MAHPLGEKHFSYTFLFSKNAINEANLEAIADKLYDIDILDNQSLSSNTADKTYDILIVDATVITDLPRIYAGYVFTNIAKKLVRDTHIYPVAYFPTKD